MTTRYQVELLNPVNGRWHPHGSPFRSMTSACLFAERMVPALDYRIMPVEVDEPVRRMVVDGQPVLVTPGVSATVVLDEIARRRVEKKTHDTSTLKGYKAALEVSGHSIVEKSDGVFDVTRDRVGTTGNELIERED